MTLTIEQGAAYASRLRGTLAECIVGQPELINDAIIAFLARGHLLVEGVPGTGKTLLVRALAAALGVGFTRVQFTPDLMPSDITGISVMRDATRGWEFQAGPIFTDLLLGDEINRAPAKTQAALLEAMAERQVTTDGVTRPLHDLFTVVATQNPVEHDGTFPLPDAQLDRFLLKSVVRYPDRDAEMAMLAAHEAGFDPERSGATALVTPVLNRDEAIAIRALADEVRVAPEVQGYIADITRATREEPGLALGASPRASVALMRASRAAAVLDGRGYVLPDDVKARVPSVLRHRVVVAPELEVEGRDADQLLDEILLRVAAPK
ncbi:MAG: MoxR family ATPase [Gemmatimonadaceae bacterium]|nr:MoxR family ATPase [Gemmatimonadaceae bacterium]MCW5825320.1 MoxR family ATPase [Gemmatimonadaceae bacterium]